MLGKIAMSPACLPLELTPHLSLQHRDRISGVLGTEATREVRLWLGSSHRQTGLGALQCSGLGVPEHRI